MESKMQLWDLSYTVCWSWDGKQFYQYNVSNDQWWSTTPPGEGTAVHYWNIIKSNPQALSVSKFTCNLAICPKTISIL